MLVTIFAPSNVHLLEIAGIRDALFEANSQLQPEQRYRVTIVTENGTPTRCASGVVYVPDAAIATLVDPCDTLIIVGPYGLPQHQSEDVAAWIYRHAQLSRRYGSTCTGAFMLAQTGLLSGRRATTHWQYAERLAAEYPDVNVEVDRIFIRDGPVFTSAGVTAAIDLTFSLIEEDHGRDLALWVARRLVVFLKRPGGQSQFSPALTAQAAVSGPVDRARQHIVENPRRNLSLTALADAARLSGRQLSRLFLAELGLSPGVYIELARLDIARRLLEESVAPIKAVANAAGFGSTATLRRAFVRQIGVTPQEYRFRFRTSGGENNNDESGSRLS